LPIGFRWAGSLNGRPAHAKISGLRIPLRWPVCPPVVGRPDRQGIIDASTTIIKTLSLANGSIR
jgi:hypothetical protein